jgi:hypothetical protein
MTEEKREIYYREKPLTKITEIEVDTLTLQKAEDHYSGHLINIENPEKSKAMVFLFGNKFFTCTGSCGLGGKSSWVEIREVVGKEHYNGPERDPWVRGIDYYLGGEINYNGQRYVMTDNLIRLVPKEIITQETLF